MKILLVDDTSEIREILSELLEQEGHMVVEAVDGQDGLWKLAQDKFDLIITDFHMPRCNGHQFAEKARQMTEAPILLHTSDATVQKTVAITAVVEKCNIEKINPFLSQKP